MTSRTGNALARAASASSCGSPAMRIDVLFGGDEHQTLGLRPGNQIRRFRRRVTVVIGKAGSFGDIDAGRGERGKELFRIADTGKGQRLAAADRRDHAAIGLKPGVENRESVPARALDHRRRAVGRTDDDQRLGAVKLQAERRPQRAGRNNVAVADAAAAIDDNDAEVLGERGVLQAVVHHHDAGAGELREFRAGDAVARDDGGREPGQQQRLVADVARRDAAPD